MSDTYQAIYDAIRSRVSNGDIGSAVESSIRDANISHYFQMAFSSIQDAASDVASAHKSPSAIYRPKFSLDGNKWCALLGDNLQEGICGFGDSPAEAAYEFDKEWFKKIEQKS